MAPKSKTESSSRSKKSKEAHPFSSATVENSFYFIRTAPRLYSAVDYFKTFDPKTLDKQRLHKHWSNALKILVDSQEQHYSDQGRRLKTLWASPGNGLGAFWQEREDAESVSEIEGVARDNIRKHSIRSAERNVLGAIQNLDDQRHNKRTKRQKKQSKGKENADPEQDSVIDETREADHGNQIQQDDDTLMAAADHELLSEKSTPSECEPSRSVSKGIYYLTGDGSTDCSQALWTPWMVNGQDLSPTLWKNRERVIDAAQRVVPLTTSVQRLAVNHIYLFERNDNDSTLFDAVGLEDWRAITTIRIEKGLEDVEMLELQKLALKLGNLNHRESEELILNWNGSTNIKKVLVGLVENDFLWSSVPFNEHELLIHVFDPLLKAYICGVTGSLGRWDQVFPPSQSRKKSLDESSLGRRPDFMLRTVLRGIVGYLFFMEAKTARQGGAVIQDDLEKLAGMMKDAIDDMSKQGVDVGKVEVICLHIVGTEGRLYAMKLEARGIYVLRSIAVVYTPRSHFDFGVLIATINVLMHIQKRLEKTITDISASHAAGEKGQDLTRPGFHTPTRVFKA
ncbi:hypothetical protein BGZ99_001205 [Dissophora globulifera]|uniref:Uncharacterized protein n=1 Tax=Dissophora globulifera TaxID=979702 RepID=A0A9P6QYW9_9FUNG|nr:hypothetical protein BGZ99_001205 [Dissophora globulifera]